MRKTWHQSSQCAPVHPTPPLDRLSMSSEEEDDDEVEEKGGKPAASPAKVGKYSKEEDVVCHREAAARIRSC